MEYTKQIIAFKHGKLIASLNNPEVPSGERYLAIVGLSNELARFGYKLSNDVIFRLSLEDVKEIYQDVIPYLATLYHKGDSFKCLYPGFPEEVFKTPENIIKENQQNIYEGRITVDEFIASDSWYSPEEIKLIDLKSSSTGLNELSYFTEGEFFGIAKSIMVSGMALAKETREELIWFLDNYPDLEIHATIPFKETMCIVAERRPNYSLTDINDLLRYAMYLMGASPSLNIVPKKIKATRWSHKPVDNPEWRKLKTISRATRRDILKRLEEIIEKRGVDYSVIDAKKFYGHWVLLSERVHSGDYALLFPKSAEFFKYLQTKEYSRNLKTWESKLQQLYRDGKSTLEIAKFISSRPGELVRRLDSLIRREKKLESAEKIVDVFLETSGMKNKTLLELLSYYDRRNSGKNRLVSSKGSTVKHSIAALPKLDPELVEFVQSIIIRKVLVNINNKVEEKDLQGKTVFLDPVIRGIVVPIDMREKTSIIPSGTRVPIEGNIVRFFVHWIQEEGKREDLDIHAKVLSDEYKIIDEIGYNRKPKLKDMLAHSGDVIGRPGDCAEYIDVNIDKITNPAYRYITIIVDNYTGRGLDTLPCWLGYSEVGSVQSDKQWIPSDVKYCQKIASTCSSIAAMVIDMKSREIIFIDSDISFFPNGATESYTSITRYYTTKHDFSTYNVLQQYYQSRGADVEELKDDSEIDKEDAMVIKANDVIKDYTKVLEILAD